MASIRAPKQWALTKQETITSFEAWRQNLQYILSLVPNFASFLLEDTTWLRKTSSSPLRGFENDGEDVLAANRRTAAQKVTHLELMLGQIANYCPVISRNIIVKNSTSVNGIWQAIRAHYGFQSTGAHFLDFNSIRLQPDERPENLYQRILSFIEDSLLKANDNIQHHGENVSADEELSPTLENMIVLNWLRLIHTDLPALVKQRFGTELRSKTLASLKPEVSQALDSLLEEIESTNEAKILRTAFQRPSQRDTTKVAKHKGMQKSCPLCKQAKRPHSQHFLSKCPFLPIEDRQYLSRAQQVVHDQDPLSDEHQSETEPEECYPSHDPRVKSVALRVSTKQSPHLKVFYNHHAINLTLDTGAETSMIKSSTANKIGAIIHKTKQTVLQADGINPLKVTGEVHLDLSRDSHQLHLDALVVSDLDVDVLAGTPFMATNDISIRPAMQQITIKGTSVTYYNPTSSDSHHHHVRCTQFHLLRSPAVASVIWPGEYLEMSIPKELEPDISLALEPRPDYTKHDRNWPRPHILEAVAGRVRILNDTTEPKTIARHEHFCQVRETRTPDIQSPHIKTAVPLPNPSSSSTSSH